MGKHTSKYNLYEHYPDISVAFPYEMILLTRLRHAWDTTWNDPFDNEERIDNLASSKLMRSCGTLSSTPLLVISRGRPDRDPASYPPGLIEQLERVCYQMQRELVGLSSRGTHLIAEHSGHLVNKDMPELLIHAIQKMVIQVRQEYVHGPLPFLDRLSSCAS